MTSNQERCASAEARQLDFWLGEWELSWPASQTGGEEGETGTGTNKLTRLFGDCVIEENFATSDGKFQGRSVSVYDEAAGIWRQTWVDSAGTYLSFTGGKTEDGFELRTEPSERDGETVVQRMVFTDITDDSLHWTWQGSRDGGTTWNDLWNISYSRTA